MKEFKSKTSVFEYISKKFKEQDTQGICVVGSTAKGKIKNFSDIDVVVFNKTGKKPFYELCLVNKKVVLITVYYYKAGKIEKIPNNGKILCGNYFQQIEHKNDRKYTLKQRTIRDNQMFLDGFFKFLRSKNKRYLDWVDKYSRI